MRGGGRGPPPVLCLLRGLFLLLLLNEPNFHEVMGHKLHQSSIPLDKEKNLHPYISPSTSPQPFIPILAPSPSGENFPKLSGLCMLNISAVGSLMKTTAVDCWAFFAPFLANVICCPQLQATLVILIGQSSKETGMLSLTMTHANHCISDVQQILANQGANDDLQQICSIHPSNLTEASCPVNDVNAFESTVDTSRLLAACQKVDPVNECCTQICQNAILEAAKKISWKDGGLSNVNGAHIMPEHASTIDDCRSVVLRWLARRLDPVQAKQVLRRISNCNVNKACPLVFPNTESVGNYCRNAIENRTACCDSMENYVSHLQKQSFITNLQALDCAALLGKQLQKANISRDVYRLCQITLKDFSLQVGNQESGCLLPSMPSDATLDQYSGVSFTCDLNDNIAAPWPSASQTSSSSCNKSIKFPELPAATSTGRRELAMLRLLVALSLVFIAHPTLPS
ncbi:putative GPI-anchored protein [Acorus calamus]|uniref:GPI-anchored protein n=1 Tax=Acorus calamus TaxID=4465 RepID=A0AAV9C448_ACOCL|nr:putative GPI-anchored protein [Acorus calamus]